jgi:hypothetical protein
MEKRNFEMKLLAVALLLLLVSSPVLFGQTQNFSVSVTGPHETASPVTASGEVRFHEEPSADRVKIHDRRSIKHAAEIEFRSFAEEGPVATTMKRKILPFAPACGLVRVPALRPLPQTREDFVINASERASGMRLAPPVFQRRRPGRRYPASFECVNDAGWSARPSDPPCLCSPAVPGDYIAIVRG